MSASITGTWYNELASEVQFIQSGGEISGQYKSYVGRACNGEYWFPLSGRTNLEVETIKDQGAVSWSVAWYNETCGDSKSATAWSGQYQVIDGKEKITATWLLTTETDVSGNWFSTIVGKDYFARDKPSLEEVQESMDNGFEHSNPFGEHSHQHDEV